MKWFRLWHDMIDNPKIQNLPNRLFKAYINTLCIASANEPRGTLPDLTKFAFKMRMKPSEAQKLLAEMENLRLIFAENSTFFVHDWDEHQRNSDNISVRVQRHREKSNVTGNVTETENETKNALQDRGTEERRQEEKEESPLTPQGETDTTKTKTRKSKNEYSTEFEELWAIYPPSAGGIKPDKLGAFQCMNARLREGDSFEIIKTGLINYRAFCDREGRTNGKYVLNPKTFFGPNKRYMEYQVLNKQTLNDQHSKPRINNNLAPGYKSVSAVGV